MIDKFLFTPELLKSCIVELSEKYNIGYSYEDDGIYLSVCKHDGKVTTLVHIEVLPWPNKDKFYIIQRTNA